MEGVGAYEDDGCVAGGGESGGWATALQKGVARGEGVLECGGLTPLWVGGARVPVAQVKVRVSSDLGTKSKDGSGGL